MTTTPPLRVGVVGAGAISEFHARALQRVPHAALVAVADTDLGRATALATRWNVPTVGRTFADICSSGLDVVHVLTRSSTHVEIALDALEHGCHVYVEKPCATSPEDCDRLTTASLRAGRHVAVGHSLLRDPNVVRAFRLVQSGVIGDVRAVDYVRAQACSVGNGPLSADLAAGGHLFRDVGIHGMYLIEALLGPIADVQTQIAATGADPTAFCEDWQVLARCARGSARLHLSSVVRPPHSTLTVFGTAGSIRADLFANTVTVRRAYPGPAPVGRVVNSITESLQIATQTAGAVAATAIGRMRQFHGVQALVEDFYGDLSAGRPPAVTPADARSVVHWTEVVACQGDHTKRRWTASFETRRAPDVLVTGAGGFVGRRLVERLAANGHVVRALVRREPPVHWRDDPRIEVVAGDLADAATVDRAVSGTRVVFHVGAVMRGTADEFERGTVVGTRHVVDAAVSHGVDRVVYMSSLAVLHAAAFTGAPVDESWPVEPRPDARGHYTRAKTAAEKLVLDAVAERGLRAIVLRPGEIVSKETALLSSGIGHRLGSFLVVFGDGSLRVPLVALDDVVEAMITAAQRGPADGTIVHLVDPQPVTQRALLARWQSTAPTPVRIVHIPRALVFAAGFASEILLGLVRRPSPLSRYRLTSALAPRAFSVRRAMDLLGWQPAHGIHHVTGTQMPEPVRVQGPPAIREIEERVERA